MKLSLASIEPLFEKIEKLSKLVRILICVVIVAIPAGLFIGFSYYPSYQKIGELKAEIETKEGELSIAKKKAGQLKKVKKERKAVEAEFNVAKKALPERAEIPDLLTNISRAGQESGLEFILFEPGTKKKKKKRKKKKGEAEEEKKFYVDIPISIAVIGTYHNTVLFFDKVSRLNRIVNIKDIKMVSPQGGKLGKSKRELKENEVIASCTALTYQFVDIPPSSKKDKDKKKK